MTGKPADAAGMGAAADGIKPRVTGAARMVPTRGPEPPGAL